MINQLTMTPKPSPHQPLPAPPTTDILLRGLFLALGLTTSLFLALFGIVTTVQSIATTPALSRSTSLERTLGYILAMVGYLLVPSIIGLLVRRRKTVVAQRAHLDGGIDGQGTLDSAGGGYMDAFAWMFPQGRYVADVDRAAPRTVWTREEARECAVCLGEVVKGQTARVLPCGHGFHAGCAELWLVTGRRNCCPLCLGKVVKRRDEGMVLVRRRC